MFQEPQAFVYGFINEEVAMQPCCLIGGWVFVSSLEKSANIQENLSIRIVPNWCTVIVFAIVLKNHTVSRPHRNNMQHLGPVYTKLQRQRCDNSAMTLQNGFATHFQASLLISMRTESVASSQSSRSIDADAWCKRALRNTWCVSYC